MLKNHFPRSLWSKQVRTGPESPLLITKQTYVHGVLSPLVGPVQYLDEAIDLNGLEHRGEFAIFADASVDLIDTQFSVVWMYSPTPINPLLGENIFAGGYGYDSAESPKGFDKIRFWVPPESLLQRARYLHIGFDIPTDSGLDSLELSLYAI